MDLSDPHADPDPHRYSNAHTDRYTHASANGYPDAHSNRHIDAHSNGYSDAHSNTFASTNIDGQPIWFRPITMQYKRWRKYLPM